MDGDFLRAWLGSALAFMGIICFFSAAFTKWAYRNNRTLLPIKNERVRQVVLTVVGLILLVVGSIIAAPGLKAKLDFLGF